MNLPLYTQEREAMTPDEFVRDVIHTKDDGHDFLPLGDVLDGKWFDPTNLAATRDWIDRVLDGLVDDLSEEHQACWRDHSNEILDLAADYCVIDDETQYSLITTKGEFAGTRKECADWLVENQPAFERLADLPAPIAVLLTEQNGTFSLMEQK